MLLPSLLKSCNSSYLRYVRWSAVRTYQTSNSKKPDSLARFLTVSEHTKSALKNIPDVKHAPASALVYGFGGLIPFTSIPLYMFQSGIYIPELVYANLAYGAVILSYLGGIRWGVTVAPGQAVKPDWTNLTWAIAPSLIAWSSLLVNSTNGLLLAISGFLLCLNQDIKNPHYPSWFRSLRILLSTAAILALLATLLSQYSLPLEGEKGKNLV